MSNDEIKAEINKVLDHLPDRALEELLVFLKGFDKKIHFSGFDENEFKRILIEDGDLLKRLAQ